MAPFTESFGWERPIEEIEVGDRVWAWNEETGESELAEVVRLFERETLEVYTLHVGVGEVLETTDEHPFWVVGRGWVEVEDLRPGDILTSYEGQELRLVAVDRQERMLQVLKRYRNGGRDRYTDLGPSSRKAQEFGRLRTSMSICRKVQSSCWPKRIADKKRNVSGLLSSLRQ